MSHRGCGATSPRTSEEARLMKGFILIWEKWESSAGFYIVGIGGFGRSRTTMERIEAGGGGSRLCSKPHEGCRGLGLRGWRS